MVDCATNVQPFAAPASPHTPGTNDTACLEVVGFRAQLRKCIDLWQAHSLQVWCTSGLQKQQRNPVAASAAVFRPALAHCVVAVGPE